MEILPYEQMDYAYNKIGIDDVSITYIQDGDCTENKGEVQSLVVSARNNGVARFINIKTDSWSIDNIEELCNILEDFRKRASL